MTKLIKVYSGVSLAYVGVVIVLYLRGAGFLAAYLTIPAWFVTSILSFVIASNAPDSLIATAILSSTGNFVALVLSAMGNVAGVYALVRILYS